MADEQLIQTIRGYSREYEKGTDHVERWQEALVALGGISPMTPERAREYANRGWARWLPVAAALELDAEQEGATETGPAAPAPPTPMAPTPQRQHTREIEEVAQYMIRGFHDWISDTRQGGRFFFEPGFRNLIGQRQRIITVHYLGLRDDWEDDCRRALDAWQQLGFEFEEDDAQSADVVVDDEKKGAFANRRFTGAGRLDDGRIVAHTVAREINVWKEWPEWSLYDSILHEIGHIMGLGHPGPYDGQRPPQPTFAGDKAQNTIMSYFGGEVGRLGEADRLAIEMIYET